MQLGYRVQLSLFMRDQSLAAGIPLMSATKETSLCWEASAWALPAAPHLDSSLARFLRQLALWTLDNCPMWLASLAGAPECLTAQVL